MSRVREALEQGTKRGRAIARETMEMVRDALDLNYLGFGKNRVGPKQSFDPMMQQRRKSAFVTLSDAFSMAESSLQACKSKISPK
jgi:hypothetical protein